MNFRDGKTQDQAPSRGLRGEDFLVWHSKTREMLGEKFWKKKKKFSPGETVSVAQSARREVSRKSLVSCSYSYWIYSSIVKYLVYFTGVKILKPPIAEYLMNNWIPFFFQVGKSHSYLYHSACIWGVEIAPPSPCIPGGSFVTCSSDDTVRVWNLDDVSINEDSVYQRNIYTNVSNNYGAKFMAKNFGIWKRWDLTVNQFLF